jgi:hypothetical protein
LDQWFPDSERRLRDQNRTPDRSWFITNSRGDQIARAPRPDPSNETIGKNFAWRSYFHGGTEEFDPGDPLPALTPRTNPDISTAFRSNATGEYMVAMAVPVWDEDHVQVVGILARTLHLTDLLSQWEDSIRGDAAVEARFLALVDTRQDAGFLLDHEWMTPDTLRGLTDKEIEQQLRLDDTTLKQLAAVGSSERYSDDFYRDPVANIDSKYDDQWLAAFALVSKQSRWYAIVQESKAQALKPVDELEGVFWKYGGWSLVVFSLMLGILWYLIHRASGQKLGVDG